MNLKVAVGVLPLHKQNHHVRDWHTGWQASEKEVSLVETGSGRRIAKSLNAARTYLGTT